MRDLVIFHYQNNIDNNYSYATDISGIPNLS